VELFQLGHEFNAIDFPEFAEAETVDKKKVLVEFGILTEGSLTYAKDEDDEGQDFHGPILS
jgi:hypothetical protein